MLLGLLLIALAPGGVESRPAKSRPVASDAGEFIVSQYPPRALAAGEQGRVSFRTDIDKKGNVTSCTIMASSGYERLDRETCDMMVENAKFKPVLDSNGKPQDAAHIGYVNWRIPGATVTATKVATAARERPAKVVCKHTQKTGSLIQNSRVCMTAKEWSRQADQYQEDWGAIQGKQGSTNGR